MLPAKWRRSGQCLSSNSSAFVNQTWGSRVRENPSIRDGLADNTLVQTTCPIPSRCCITALLESSREHTVACFRKCLTPNISRAGSRDPIPARAVGEMAFGGIQALHAAESTMT